MLTTARVITVGDEILTGEILNTNSQYLAQNLMACGIRPVSHLTVADNVIDVSRAITKDMDYAGLTIITGGLGSTPDDVTREAVADATGYRLYMDQAIREHIANQHSFGDGTEESIDRQSRVLESAIVWNNEVGTAPGMRIRVHDHWIVLLPGPPRELRFLAENYLWPWLKSESSAAIIRDTYVIYNVPEPVVSYHLKNILRGQHPSLGIYTKPGRVELRFEAANTMAGQVLINRAVSWARAHSPALVYYFGEKSREEVLIDALIAQQAQIAAMESLTGGWLMSRLISVPGASSCVSGGTIAYSNEAKIQAGVPQSILEEFGAVSAQCAEQMARAIANSSHAQIGISTTGFAGPSGGTESEPIGTFYVAGVRESRCIIHRLNWAHSDRQSVREAAVEGALTVISELLNISEDAEFRNDKGVINGERIKQQ